MKKLISLLLAVLMLTSVVFAEDILEADPEEVMTFYREIDKTVVDWEGKWVLVAAYIGEEFAEEYDVDTTGLIAVPENILTMEITAVLDGSANDKALGTMVDVASYIHAHVYDMEGTLEFADGDSYTIKSAWDEWPNYVIRGELDGDFNFGPAKTHIKGEDGTLRFCEITGVEIEDLEDMKYIGMNEAGQLILCYSDNNIAKKEGEVGVAYIFDRVEEEE